MRGRKPKPSVLAALHGRTSHGRMKSLAEPKPPGSLADVEPPAFLTDRQRTIWGSLLADAPPGLLTPSDGPLLAALAVAVDVHQRAATELAAMGTLTQSTPNGMAVPVPLIGVLHRQATLITRICAEVGFSPTARARVAATPADAETDADIPLEEYLAARPALPGDLRQEGRDRPPRKPH
jgi:P27 family predicted phage terminase small subunit